MKKFTLLLLLATSSAFAYYDNTQGRFISRDPIGYADGMNLHQYARSNPTRYGDSLGLIASISMPPIIYDSDMQDTPCGDYGSDVTGVTCCRDIVPVQMRTESCGCPGMTKIVLDPAESSATIYRVLRENNQHDEPGAFGLTTEEHENFHATLFAYSINKRDEVFNYYAGFCLPTKCVNKIQHLIYERAEEISWKNIYLNAVFDYIEYGGSYTNVAISQSHLSSSITERISLQIAVEDACGSHWDLPTLPPQVDAWPSTPGFNPPSWP